MLKLTCNSECSQLAVILLLERYPPQRFAVDRELLCIICQLTN
jgi:hypothetical protein